MATMFDIDKAAFDYSAAHDVLAGIMTTIDDAVTMIKREHMSQLRRAVEKAAAKKAALRDLVDESREQFERPKTRILHGVQVGLQKGKGKLVIADEDVTVKLIKKHFADQVDILLRIVERPNKNALNSLDAKELKKIGATLEDAGDQIIIKPTDSEIDKLVDALLAENDEPEAA